MREFVNEKMIQSALNKKLITIKEAQDMTLCYIKKKSTIRRLIGHKRLHTT